MSTEVENKIDEYEEKLLNEVKRISAKKSVSITINKERKPSLTDSKFGGLPYWDVTKEYPKSESGNKLVLLAQINLDVLNLENKNPEDKLPKGGMLQFFIDLDQDSMGFDYDYNTDSDGRIKQDGFRVVYHKTIEYNVSADEIKKIADGKEDYNNYSPVKGEYAIDFCIKEAYIDPNDANFSSFLKKAAKNIGVEMTNYELFDIFSDNGEMFFDGINNNGHWLLGYPTFTQDDPRSYQESVKKFNLDLFQMDSDGNFTCWGDCGIAHFMISEEDLAKEDFRDVLYCWDCY